MLTIPSGKAVFLGGALWALLASGTSLALAGDHHHGTTYYSKVTQYGSLNAGPTYPVVGLGTYQLAPFSYHYSLVTTAPTYYYSWAVPTTTTSYLPAPTAATTYGVPAIPTGTYDSAPTLLSSALASPPSQNPAASAVPAASTDYLPDYLAFLQQEASKYPATIYQPAGVRPNPADLAAFQQNHAQLVAVLGADRLASIGRFLLTKRQDPNFRPNALKLFEPLLGVYLPQYVPLIDQFLADLRQGAAPSTAIVDDRAPAAPSRPISPSLVKDSQTGHFIATDANGIKTEFDAEMKPISTTSPDGKVTKF